MYSSASEAQLFWKGGGIVSQKDVELIAGIFGQEQGDKIVQQEIEEGRQGYAFYAAEDEKF